VPGTSATTNWTDAANWAGVSPAQTYYNQVQFIGIGAVGGPGIINNVLDNTTGVAQMPIWELDIIPTNVNYTTLISPGKTLSTGAGNGKLYVGCDQITAGGVVNAVETISFTGAGGTLSVGGNLRVGQGCTNSTVTSLHNVTLDLSGLDNFVMTPNVTGTRLMVCGQGQSRAQGTVYLAKTNNILLGNDLEIGAMSTFSNTVPCGLYLGQTNTILTGNGGASSDTITVGSRSCTNGFMKFNPAFIGGANPTPFASFASPTNVNGGRVNIFYVGYAVGGAIPATGYCDLSGGNISILATTMLLGTGGASNALSGTGILTFDNGTIDANTLVVGNQATSAGGAGIGIVNMSTNCTLKVNSTLALAASVGTPAAGNAGTINMNGGTLMANLITNGTGLGTINMTNATWQVAVTPGSVASVSATVTNFVTGGATNTIVVTFAAPLTHLPSTNRLVHYMVLGGKGLTGMGLVLPANDPPYEGYLANNPATGEIDLIITNGVVPTSLVWSGSVNGDWDIGTTANWLDANNNAADYTQGANVLFDDTASGTTTVNLTSAAQLTPSTLTVNNVNKIYTFSGTGSLGGSATMSGAIVGGVTKQGSGTFVLAHTGTDTYLGGINIAAGILQVGDGATYGGGSLGPSSGAVINNGGLVFNRPDGIAVTNVISGAGGLTNKSSTLLLAGANTFTGPVYISPNTTLTLGNAAALGTTAGATYVPANATLDLSGFNPGSEPIVVQGAGAGSGAIVNNSSSGTPQLKAVTLAGDTTFGGGARWDLQGTLSSGGHAYNLTVANSAAYSAEWRDLTTDPALGNVTLGSGTTLGWVGSTTAGTNGALELTASATLKFYNDGTTNAIVAKAVILDDGSTVANGGGASMISGPITLNGYDTFDVGGTSLTLSGPLSGTGTVYKQAVASAGDTLPLIISGNSPAFNGSVLLYSGKVLLNGILGGSSSVSSQSGTSVAGYGTNKGPVDVRGALLPGDVNLAGTLTVSGLTLEASAVVTNDLSASVTGANDLIQVVGDLTVNGNTLYINPIGGTLQSGRPYTLITYTGNLNGSFAGVQMASASPYTLVLSNATSLSPKQIQVIVTGGSPSVLVWKNASGNSEWDVQSSANWSNVISHVSADVFFSADSVTLDDSITNSAFPSTTLDIAAGVAVGPSAITNNSTTNYTIGGAGKISNGASLVKMGGSTLTLGTTNDFVGPVTILGGTVIAQTAAALGATNGTVTITNGGTLEIGNSLGIKPIVVSGAGVGGNGAINNDFGAAIYDNPGGLTTLLTLAGDATFGGTNRWDLGSSSGATLSTGGKPYSVTFTGPTNGYREWQNVAIDTNLANINIVSGQLGLKQMSALGNPTNTVTIYSGAQLTFWSGSNYTKNYYVKSNGTLMVRLDGPVFNLNVTLEGAATFSSINNAKTFTGPVNLLGLAHFQSGNNLTTFSNVISGPGGLYWDSYDNQIAFAATNTYSGPTIIGSGLSLALLGNGSILNSTPIVFAGTDTNAVQIDVSGKTDQTLTLAGGQTLLGSGRINGGLFVSSGATLSPGTNTSMGAVGADGAITLKGNTTLKLGGSQVNDLVQSGTSINCGGTLNLQFTPGSLAAGNSWKLLAAPSGSVSGSFALSPASPGSGLAWDVSTLTTDGTLRVISVTRPGIASFSFAGGNVILRGTNGPANGSYSVLTSTNVALPLDQWVPLSTNRFDGTGSFNSTNAMNPGEPGRFYLLRLQ
jgi:autotransporter-associated beta strand protein